MDLLIHNKSKNVDTEFKKKKSKSGAQLPKAYLAKAFSLRVVLLLYLSVKLLCSFS